MFNFDAERFVKIRIGAIALAAEIDAAAERYVAEGIDSVFFLGDGWCRHPHVSGSEPCGAD